MGSWSLKHVGSLQLRASLPHPHPQNLDGFHNLLVFIFLFLVCPRVFHDLTRCKDLQQLGTAFFKTQVHAKDPFIAHAASKYLIEIFQKQQPEQFTKVMNYLLEKAVSNNDEQLIFNPYLQIKSILEIGEFSL